MESLNISSHKLSREELVTGIGGSILVHVAVLALFLVGPWSVPKPSSSPPIAR